MDIAELAAKDNQLAEAYGRAFMPAPAIVMVIESTLHAQGGWVWGVLEGRRVRCIVPSTYNLTGASTTSGYLFWCLPLSGQDNAAEWLAIAPAWNGQDNSRTVRDSSIRISPVLTPANNTTLKATDEYVEAHADAGGITLTLPPAASVKGKHYWIKKMDSSGNSVTIDGNGAETIDGSATKSTSTQYAGWHIISNGSNWALIGPIP